VLKYEQESYIGDQFELLEGKIEAPFKFFDRITSPFSGLKDNNKAFSDTGFHADWVTNSLKVGLPFVFNKILFRKAGIIKKGLLLLASQQAAGLLNKDRIADFVEKVSSWVKPSKKKSKNKKAADYGIPP